MSGLEIDPSATPTVFHWSSQVALDAALGVSNDELRTRARGMLLADTASGGDPIVLDAVVTAIQVTNITS